MRTQQKLQTCYLGILSAGPYICSEPENRGILSAGRNFNLEINVADKGPGTPRSDT